MAGCCAGLLLNCMSGEQPQGMQIVVFNYQCPNNVKKSSKAWFVEGLAERINWLQGPVADDVYGSALLDAGIDATTIQAWSVDPQVALPGGGKGSIFDALEDLDAGACTSKAVEISKAGAL